MISSAILTFSAERRATSAHPIRAGPLAGVARGTGGFRAPWRLAPFEAKHPAVLLKLLTVLTQALLTSGRKDSHHLVVNLRSQVSDMSVMDQGAPRLSWRMRVSSLWARVSVGRFENLAPHIHRQRLVIEGQCPESISADEICAYLSELSKQIDMVELLSPVTHRSDRFGWAGWIHWETSGAHFYAWEEDPNFFSVDIYTCKAFSVSKAVEFTRNFFNASKVVHKSF